MNTKGFEKLVSVLLAGAVLMVVANAWLAFQAEQVLDTSELWVAHTWEVIAGIDHAMSLVKDAETGARGFLITGDLHYLAPRDTAASLLPGELTHLLDLVSDNPAQEEHMAEMANVATKRMDLITYTVGVRRTQGQAAAFAVVKEGLGIAEMDRLRALSGQMQQIEHGLLTGRLRASAHARTEARVAVAFASTLDILFILLTLWSLGHERRLRQKANETALRLEKLQAISDVGLTQLSVSDLTDAMLGRLRTMAEIDGVALCAWQVDELVVTAAEGVAIKAGFRVKLPPDGPLRQSGSTGRVMRLNGAEVLAMALPAFHEEMRSVLILPLTVSAQVIGVLVVGRRSVAGFGTEDDELLLVVADRIALAIDRASLFEAESAARRAAEGSAQQVRLLNAELEERVRMRTSELEAINSELEAFSYSVSHDLRAPLRSVDGFSVALEEDYGAMLTGEGKHYLARIRAGVQRMGQLIDALLQLSRITRLEMVVEQVELSELARDVAQELQQQHPGRHMDFLIEPGLRTQGDPRLLRAVFENMLGNAVKFTAKTAHALIEVGFLPDRCAYFIRDNGAGFDQQYAKKLFVAFQRLHGERDFQGSGIGLATVARVIRRHHGTIGAEGAVGKGATFWFTLGADQ